MLLSDIHTRHEFEHGDRTAYKSGNVEVSFKEFAIKVRQLASCLIRNGVKRGDRVGVFLPRSVETAIAVHGIMRAGAIWVPLDIFAPESRILELIADCNMQCLITAPSVRAKCDNLRNLVPLFVGLDENTDVENITWDEVYNEDEAACPIVELESSDPAYIIYTSGTTGKPKGIVHTHFSGMAYARLSSDLYEVGHNDVVASHAPLHVDMCTFAFLTSPFAGATTIIIPEAYLKLPASLSGLMERERITIWYSVPLALTQLLENGVLHERDLSSIRWVLYGGEPFQTSALGNLMNLWPEATFCNVYGPAEVNQCTYYHIPTVPDPGTSIPLGYVWDETSARIVNEHGADVDNDTVGELLIASSTRMKEYWGRPDLTARAFVQFQDTDGVERTYYHTGDLVSRDEQGLLHFMGRKDRQVKIKGFRIELSEVEAILNGMGSIDAGAVVAPKDESGNRRLVAFIVSSSNRPTEAEMVEYLSQHLPSHAVPNTFNFSEILPTTSAGKLDYAQLERKAEQLA